MGLPDPILGVRLPEELRLALEEKALERRVSVSHLVREMLRTNLRPVLVRRGMVRPELQAAPAVRRAG